jgi:hypothetical protein
MSDPWLTLNLVLPAIIAAVGTAGALVVAAANGRFSRRSLAPVAVTPTGPDQDTAAARVTEQDPDTLRSTLRAQIDAAEQQLIAALVALQKAPTEARLRKPATGEATNREEPVPTASGGAQAR